MSQKTLDEYHSNDSPNECRHCGREIANAGALTLHERACQDGAKKTYTCANCGGGFEDYPSRRETRGRETFYCSRDCKYEHETTGEWRECAWCGDELYRAECQLSEMGDYSIDHHFCGKTCEGQWKRRNWVRHDHPNWQGGSGGVNAVRHALSDVSWQHTARKVRKDAKNVCENCGEEPSVRSLDVHHIIPVAAGGTNEPWNLMALCIPCHRRAEEWIRKITTPHLYKYTD